MKLGFILFAALLILASAIDEQDQGAVRLRRLRERSLQSSNRIISFGKADFELVSHYIANTS